MRYLRRQPISCLLILAIWIVCMMPVPETPLDNVKFIDKWTHLCMYGGLVFVIMVEYGKRNLTPAAFCPSAKASKGEGGITNSGTFNIKRLLVGGLVLPIIMGGLVELAQAYLTNGVRSGDWLDFAANSTGALSGAVIGIPLARYLATRNKDA